MHQPMFQWGSKEVQMLRSVKNHPRYGLRMAAIGSASLGVFFTILSLAICGEPILHGLAFIPLCLSLIWSHMDLLPTRLSKQSIPMGLVVFVDFLAFLVFLALLIANGIIVVDMWINTGDAMLMTYTSVPWMVSCTIHGYVTLHSIWQVFVTVHRNCLVCPKCSHDWKVKQNEPGPGTDRADYSLLRKENTHDNDVESYADVKSIHSMDSDETTVLSTPSVSTI